MNEPNLVANICIICLILIRFKGQYLRIRRDTDTFHSIYERLILPNKIPVSAIKISYNNMCIRFEKSLLSCPIHSIPQISLLPSFFCCTLAKYTYQTLNTKGNDYSANIYLINVARNHLVALNRFNKVKKKISHLPITAFQHFILFSYWLWGDWFY